MKFFLHWRRFDEIPDLAQIDATPATASEMINISFDNEIPNSEVDNYEMMAEECAELDRIVDIADNLLLNLDTNVARNSEEQRAAPDRECAVSEEELVQHEADSNARFDPGAPHYDDAELELTIADAEALAAAHIAAPHPKTPDPIFAPLLLPPPVVDISNLCC